MSKHSPGPWKWEPDEYSKGAGHIVDCNGAHVVFAHRCDQPTGLAYEADARLIAAAPELLEALKQAQAWMFDALQAFEGHPSPSENRGKDIDAAMCALIRRIEGEG